MQCCCEKYYILSQWYLFRKQLQKPLIYSLQGLLPLINDQKYPFDVLILYRSSIWSEIWNKFKLSSCYWKLGLAKLICVIFFLCFLCKQFLSITFKRINNAFFAFNVSFYQVWCPRTMKPIPFNYISSIIECLKFNDIITWSIIFK